jgi:hypothetical protein
MGVIKTVVRGYDSELPAYRQRAEAAQATLSTLDSAESNRRQAYAEQFAAEQQRDKAGSAEERKALAHIAEQAKAKAAKADAEYRAAVRTHGTHDEVREDARKKQADYESRRDRKAELEREHQTLNAQNRKLEDRMGPVDKAREDKERERLNRDRERQEKLDDARMAREARNAKRPAYRATERAKARRAGNKLRKNRDRAATLLAVAKNPRLTRSARKGALAKARRAAQRAVDAGWEKLEATRNAAAADGVITKEEKEEIREAADELTSAEKLLHAIENEERKLAQEGQPVEPPPPDPCDLPCPCDVRCDPPDLCVCKRTPAAEGPTPPPPGGDPVPEGDGGGRAREGATPDEKVPEGASGRSEADGDIRDPDRAPPPPKPGGGRGPKMFWARPTVAAPPGVFVETRTVASPRSTVRVTVKKEPEAGEKRAPERNPACADCASAIREIKARAAAGNPMTDQEAVECLWAALGGWKGYDSPFQAALAEGLDFEPDPGGGWPDVVEAVSMGYARLRVLMIAACRERDPFADPEWFFSPEGREFWGAPAVPPPKGWWEKWLAAGASWLDEQVTWIAQSLGAAFGLGLEAGMQVAAWILGREKPSIDELLEPLVQMIAEMNPAELSAFKRWAIGKLAALVEGIADPGGHFKAIAIGVLDSPAALAEAIRRALKGDRRALIDLADFAASFRKGGPKKRKGGSVAPEGLGIPERAGPGRKAPQRSPRRETPVDAKPHTESPPGTAGVGGRSGRGNGDGDGGRRTAGDEGDGGRDDGERTDGQRETGEHGEPRKRPAGPSKPFDWEHILDGDTSGFHSRPGGVDPPNARVISQGSPDAGGVYEAKVEITNPETGVVKTKNSTFFPDEWSHERVKVEVEAAYERRVYPDPNNPRKWAGVSPSGVRIEGYDDPTRTTAYPVRAGGG